MLKNYIVPVEVAIQILSQYADEDGIVKGEAKLGGNRHAARFVSTKADKRTNPQASALMYINDSPASVFMFNAVIKGTRGKAKTPIPDRMVAVFYTKDAVLKGATEFGPALKVHTNCTTLYYVDEMPMQRTFGTPLCAIECPFALKDAPADPSRPQAPYAKAWENFLSTTLHCHNVANLNNSRYDLRIMFVNND